VAAIVLFRGWDAPVINYARVLTPSRVWGEENTSLRLVNLTVTPNPNPNLIEGKCIFEMSTAGMEVARCHCHLGYLGADCSDAISADEQAQFYLLVIP